MWKKILLLGGGIWLYNYIRTGAALLKLQPDVSAIRFYKITISNFIIDLHIRLQNLSTIPVTLNGIQYSLYINNEFFGSASTPLNYTLKNYQSVTIPLRMSLSTSKILSLLGKIISNQKDTYPLHFELKGRVGGNSVSFPLFLRFDVNVPSLLSLYKKIQDAFNTGNKNDLTPPDPGQPTL